MADDWARVFAGFDELEPPADLWERAVERAAAGGATPRRAWPGWRMAALVAVAVVVAIAAAVVLRSPGGSSTPVFRVDSYRYLQAPPSPFVNPGGPVKLRRAATREVVHDQLSAVSAAAADDAWIVGTAVGGRPLSWRWNGRRWQATPIPPAHAPTTLLAVTTLDATTAWAVGSTTSRSGQVTSMRPVIERWDGARWSVQPLPGVGSGWLSAVSAASPSDAWAIGVAAIPGRHGVVVYRALVLHWNGRRWRRLPAGIPAPILSAQITALGGDDVWLRATSQSRSVLARWTGNGWRRIPGPFGPDDPTVAMSVLSPSDVWAGGSFALPSQRAHTLTGHWDGRGWQIASSPNQGRVLNGHNWVTTPYPTPDSDSGISVLAAISRDDVWAFGSTYYQRKWITPAGCKPTHTCWQAVRYSPPAPLAMRWNGRGWTLEPAPLIAAGTTPVVAAIPGGGVWAIGSTSRDNVIELWNGHRWQAVPHPPDRTRLSSR